MGKKGILGLPPKSKKIDQQNLDCIMFASFQEGGVLLTGICLEMSLDKKGINGQQLTLKWLYLRLTPVYGLFPSGHSIIFQNTH